MKTISYLFPLGLVITLATGCGKSTTAPTPVAPTPSPAPTPVAALVFTLQSDSLSPVGQAVAITEASRQQSPGKFTVAVTGFNLRNILPEGTTGVQSIEGRLKYDDAVFELERTTETLQVGDFMLQGNVSVFCCKQPPLVVAPGLYPFFVRRNDTPNVQGSGELFLATFKPRPGVTSTTTRVELATFNASESDPRVSYTTPLIVGPYLPLPNIRSIIDNAYGATITIRPGS